MTPKREPRDQAVRNGAMWDLNTSIFLEAGAGTGKTSVLVGRVVEAVRRGRAELRQIVAITFTEKAAGELRHRVRRDLYAALQAGDEEECERLRTALDQVDSAHIETIHAFASSLLRERPLDAGLDPNFAVLDAVSEQLAFDEEWENWLWSEEESAARPRIERCLRLDLTLGRLRDLAHNIAEFRDIDPRQKADPVPAAETVHARALTEARALPALAEAVSAPVARDVAELLAELEGMTGLPSEALEAELGNVRPPRLRAGRAPNEARIRCAEAVQNFADAQTDYATRVRGQALAEFIEVTYAFVQEAAAERRRRGRLTFQDLLIEARNLLVNDAGVRRYFRSRYRFLLIDEFQDTDPLQAEIVLLLAAANDDATSWRDVEIAPGRLFIVGDPKQSIYRFRRADIDTYAEVEANFRAVMERDPQRARVASLEVNFRSRPELVEWHNHIFSALIQRNAAFPRAQPDYQRLSPFRDDQGPGVLTLQPNTGISWRRVGEARQDEASAIARLIETMVRTEDLPLRIADRGAPGGARPPRYRDICLLVRNRTNLELYTAALNKAGIPYHLDSGRGFFRQQEIRDAAAILAAIDDPSDEVAVVAALKSSPFAASDQELLEFSQPQPSGKRGHFQLRASAIPDDYDGPLRQPIEELTALAEQEAAMSLPAFVDRVLRSTHLLEVQLARGSVQRAANLQIIVQRAADFAANEIDSLRPFVRWLGSQSRTDLAEAESPVTEIDDDVVRILTIHQAKGLEFPVVVMAKMAAAEAPDRSIAVVDREQGTIDFQIGTRERRFQTPGYEAARERQEVYEEAEERRLFYVAATRARDWLVLPVFFTDRTPGYHRLLDEALPGWISQSDDIAAPGAITYRVEHLSHVAPPERRITRPDAPALLKRWQEAHASALEAGAAAQQLIVPSQIGEDEPKLPRETEPSDRSGDEFDPAAAGDGGAALGATGGSDSLYAPSGIDGRARGTAVHDALFLADLADWAKTEWRARKLCSERSLDDWADEIVAHLRRAFDSDVLARTRDAVRVERELPLVAVSPERVMEGYVDLAFLPAAGAGWVLVDYKTDRDPSAESIGRYEQQVQAYAEMFRQTGQPVAEACLLFTIDGRTHPVPLP